MGYAVFVAVGLLLVIAWFLRENHRLHQRVVVLDEQLREAQIQKSKPAKPAKSDKPVEQAKVSADAELARDLDDARAEIKDLKKQVYDLKKGSRELKEQIQESEDRPNVPDSNVVFSLREEIAELKAENARLEDKLATASKAGKASPPPMPKKEEEKKEAPPVAAAAVGASGDLDGVKAKYEKDIDALRAEVRDLEKRLKSTAANVDKQRRRADNNDRAYKITQRQYDAAQERVALLEEQVKKAGFAAQPAAEPPAEDPKGPPKLALKKPTVPTASAAAPSAAITKPKPPTPKPEAPKPEVGSTTVLSPMALAMASKTESPAEESEESTVHRARPITADDLDAPAEDPSPMSEASEPAAYESGGHTAVLTPGALAATFAPSEEKSEPAADESGGHTAVLSAANLSKAITVESAAAGGDDEDERETIEAPRDTGERTAILGPSAFRPADDGDEDPAPAGGRRPSSGLFGMPDDVFDVPDEEQDRARSTQFAFPTQMMNDDESGATARFSPVENAELKPARLGATVDVGENPAEESVPDSGAQKGEGSNRLGGGGRLGDLDLGDLDSAIDDAWGDLDVD